MKFLFIVIVSAYILKLAHCQNPTCNPNEEFKKFLLGCGEATCRDPANKYAVCPKRSYANRCFCRRYYFRNDAGVCVLLVDCLPSEFTQGPVNTEVVTTSTTEVVTEIVSEQPASTTEIVTEDPASTTEIVTEGTASTTEVVTEGSTSTTEIVTEGPASTTELLTEGPASTTEIVTEEPASTTELLTEGPASTTEIVTEEPVNTGFQIEPRTNEIVNKDFVHVEDIIESSTNMAPTKHIVHKKRTSSRSEMLLQSQGVIMSIDTMPSCKGDNEVYSCGVQTCVPHCKGVNSICKGATFQCQNGCFCKPGYFRNEKLNCVLKSECPKPELFCCKNQVEGCVIPGCEAICGSEFCSSCSTSKQKCQISCVCKEGFIRKSHKSRQCIPNEMCLKKNALCH